MSSSKQIIANRLNAKKSTGPKSEEGKANVSKNAIKHGLLTTETILPWENSLELKNLEISYFDSLKPEGAIEEMLVDRIISIAWRLRRAGRVETGIFAIRRYSLNSEIVQMENNTAGATEAVHLETTKALTTNSDLPELALIFINDSTSLSTLQRYESNLEKSFYKALHELQRLKSVRNGLGPAASVAIDIHGDIGSES